jgi:hypothetical protein
MNPPNRAPVSAAGTEAAASSQAMRPSWASRLPATADRRSTSDSPAWA